MMIKRLIFKNFLHIDFSTDFQFENFNYSSNLLLDILNMEIPIFFQNFFLISVFEKLLQEINSDFLDINLKFDEAAESEITISFQNSVALYSENLENLMAKNISTSSTSSLAKMKTKFQEESLQYFEECIFPYYKWKDKILKKRAELWQEISNINQQIENDLNKMFLQFFSILFRNYEDEIIDFLLEKKINLYKSKILDLKSIILDIPSSAKEDNFFKSRQTLFLSHLGKFIEDNFEINLFQIS